MAALIPALGAIRLRALTEQHIARAYAELARPREVTITHAGSRRTETRVHSAATLLYAHAVLHGALAQAVAWRLIERNPAAGASLPRATTPEMRPLSPAEARRFLEAAEGHPLEPLFVLAVTTWMRQGELLGLRWRDVDWEARRIAVHHTLVRMNGRWWLGEPKTAVSRRAIQVTDPTIDMLRTHWARQAERLLVNGHRMTDDDLVFCDAAGTPCRHCRPRRWPGWTRSSAGATTRRRPAPVIRAPIRAPPPPRRQTKGPIRAWIGPMTARLVPHTGFPVKCLIRLSRVHRVHPRDA